MTTATTFNGAAQNMGARAAHLTVYDLVESICDFSNRLLPMARKAKVFGPDEVITGVYQQRDLGEAGSRPVKHRSQVRQQIVDVICELSIAREACINPAFGSWRAALLNAQLRMAVIHGNLESMLSDRRTPQNATNSKRKQAKDRENRILEAALKYRGRMTRSEAADKLADEDRVPMSSGRIKSLLSKKFPGALWSQVDSPETDELA